MNVQRAATVQQGPASRHHAQPVLILHLRVHLLSLTAFLVAVASSVLLMDPANSVMLGSFVFLEPSIHVPLLSLATCLPIVPKEATRVRWARFVLLEAASSVLAREDSMVPRVD